MMKENIEQETPQRCIQAGELGKQVEGTTSRRTPRLGAPMQFKLKLKHIDLKKPEQTFSQRLNLAENASSIKHVMLWIAFQ